jgi:hypothetical protein
MEWSRAEFLKLSVAIGGAALTAGCGGGSSGGDCAANGAHDTAISGNHGHRLTIPAADLQAGLGKTYDITGSADHSHTVAVSGSELTQLTQGESVVASTSVTDGHSHEVTMGCA